MVTIEHELSKELSYEYQQIEKKQIKAETRTEDMEEKVLDTESKEQEPEFMNIRPESAEKDKYSLWSLSSLASGRLHCNISSRCLA